MGLFGWFGGKKEFGNEAHAPIPEASKGYHSCVATCEEDIENLETEADALRKDNEILIGKLSASQVSGKQLQDNAKQDAEDKEYLGKRLSEKDTTIVELEDRIKELELRLEEADEKADGTPVKYASARKALTKAKLSQLRKALEAAPNGQGFGGSCSVYDKKTKRVSLVEFKSKADALDLLDKAEKGNVDIIM